MLEDNRYQQIRAAGYCVFTSGDVAYWRELHHENGIPDEEIDTFLEEHQDVIQRIADALNTWLGTGETYPLTRLQEVLE